MTVGLSGKEVKRIVLDQAFPKTLNETWERKTGWHPKEEIAYNDYTQRWINFGSIALTSCFFWLATAAGALNAASTAFGALMILTALAALICYVARFRFVLRHKQPFPRTTFVRALLEALGPLDLTLGRLTHMRESTLYAAAHTALEHKAAEVTHARTALADSVLHRDASYADCVDLDERAQRYQEALGNFDELFFRFDKVGLVEGKTFSDFFPHHE